MPDLSEWNALCARCESVYEKYGSTPIPTTLSDDPCQVFLETRVDENGAVCSLYIMVKETTLFICMVRPHS